MFSALYGDPELEREPSSGSRQMMNHFGTHFLNEDGSWKNLMKQKNSTSDMACLTSQFPRLVGLAQASKIYRNNKDLAASKPGFTDNGNEIAFAEMAKSPDFVAWSGNEDLVEDALFSLNFSYGAVGHNFVTGIETSTA